MVDDTDGVGESFDNSLRIALTVASQFGERITRLREEASRQREGVALQGVRELQNRLDAERGAARAQLAVVNQPSWWDRAGTREIADARETAVVWRGIDDVAAQADETIRREVLARYGVDVNAAGADPGAVADALGHAEADRARSREEQRRAGEELTASQLLLASAESRDRAVDDAALRDHEMQDPALHDDSAAAQEREAVAERSQSAVAYDSAERRSEFARSLEGTATAEEVKGRVLADTGNGRSAREAVVAPPAAASKARKSSRTGQQRDRGGLVR